MSSVASNVSAIPTAALPRWQPVSDVASEEDAGPFAALLDAATSAPDANDPQPTSSQGVRWADAATGQPATASSDDNGATSAGEARAMGESGGAASTATSDTDNAAATVTGTLSAAASSSTTGSQDQSRTSQTAKAWPARAWVASSKANQNFGHARSAGTVASGSDGVESQPAAQTNAKAAGSNATNGSPQGDASIASSAEAATSAAADFGVTDSAPSSSTTATTFTGKIAAGDQSAANQGDDTSTSADPNAAQGQQSLPDPQAVAVAVVAANLENSVPAAGETGASATIGEWSRMRARPGLPSPANDRSAQPAQDDPNAAPVNPSPAAADVGGSALDRSESSQNASNAAPANGSGVQQTQTGSNAVPTAQAPVTAVATADQAMPRADLLAAPATAGTPTTSNAQDVSNNAKGDMAGLPDFGFSAANPATPSALVAASASTTTAAAVPVSGLAVAIAARAQAGSNQFDIRLDPPELGRIDVRLDVGRDGQVTSHLTVDRADTLQLLQSQQPQLERALEQAGLKTADNGMQFTLRDQSFTGQNTGQNNSGAQQNTAQLILPDSDLPAVQSTQAYRRWGLGTGLDIRV